MITRMAVALLLLYAPAVQAQEQIIGLLAIPEVFGTGPCERFTPAEIPLYSALDSAAVIGWIRVDEYWRFPDAGGCEGLVVNVHMAALREISELPTREYGYEAPAVLVLQQRGRWFKVRLGDGVAWLRSSPRAEYYALEQLLLDRLTYLTEAFGGGLAEAPGGEIRSAHPARWNSSKAVRVTDFSRVGEQLWLHGEVLSHSPCEFLAEPSVVAQGWTPAHSESGEPTVWFFSRGC